MADPGGPSNADSAADNSTQQRTFMRTVDAASLSALTSVQKGFITSMRLIQADDTVAGIKLKRAIADMFPPASLFHKEICDLPDVFTELRDFLDSRGANMQQHSSHRIIMTLAHNIYEETEDTQAAVEIAQSIIAAGRRGRADLSRQPEQASPTPVAGSSTNNQSTSQMEKMAHNVAMRLKEDSKKFSGDLGEAWMEFVDEYFQICRDYNLSPTQKQQYLHNLLRADAKRFYLDKVDGYATNFQQAIDMVDMEYNSPVLQTRVKNYLISLRLTTFSAKGLETSDALAKVYKTIVKLSRQAPHSHHGDAHKVEFLRNAVVGWSWAHEPLSRVATHQLTFQQLYGELEAALQLDKEAQVATLRDRAEHQGKSESKEELGGVLYTGQGRYLRDPSSIRTRKPVKAFRQKNVKPTSPFDPLSIQGCFNCDDPSHVLKDCKKPLNVSKAAARKLEYFGKKASRNTNAVQQVLADMCKQLDHSSSDESDAEGFSDLKIFHSLMGKPSSSADIQEVASNEESAAEEGPTEDTIYIINVNTQLHVIKEYLGVCIDSAAQKTVIGKEQSIAYCELMGISFSPDRSGRCAIFSFRTHKHNSLGCIEMRIPILENHFPCLKVDVVELSVPFLMGLDLLTAYRMVIDTDRFELTSRLEGWCVPLVRKLGHLYYVWPAQVLFTQSELLRMHKHFYHPNSERLYAVVKRADSEKASPELLKDLERIESTCDTCQRFGQGPHRFRVSMPDEHVVFNSTVCVDIMSLDSKPVFHIVDKDTKFSAAAFLRNETADEAWNTYMRIWACVYIGFSSVMAADQGPQFLSQRFKNLIQMAGMKLKLSGVESHNALGVGERYHFLRQIYRKVRNDHPNMSLENALVLSVKAMNDTAGPNGLVPTLLVFGVLPRIPIVPMHLPEQMERMRAMEMARKEMAQVTAKERLSQAVRSNVPAAATKEIAIGSDVLVYKEKPMDKWVGPFRVLDVQGKAIYVEVKGKSTQVFVDKVKNYLRPPVPNRLETVPDISSESAVPEAQPQAGQGKADPKSDEDILSELQKITEKMRDSELEATMAGTSPESSATDPLAHFDNVSAREFLCVVEINLTEILQAEDPRADIPEFSQAKSREIDGLEDRQVWKIIRKKDLPPDANILGGRFVVALKNIGTDKEKPKARYVAQGNKDKERKLLVHNITTLRQSSTRMIVSVAAVKGYRIFCHDVDQAYLQSDEKLTRKIFLLPKKKDLYLFGLTEEDIMQLLRPLYGTGDAGDYWGVTIDRLATEDLGMTRTAGDPSLYIKPSKEDVDGCMGICIDDGVHAGNEEFQKLTEQTLVKFQSKPREWDSFDLFGTNIETVKPGHFTVSQYIYAKRLKLIPFDCSFIEFRSLRAMFGWMTHSRADICCVVNRAAQVKEETFSRDKINELNRAILAVKRSPSTALKFNPLDKSSLHLRVYADASFATNDDLSSQLGFVILLCDKSDRCHFLDFSSRKSKRVVRAILGGEVYAFSDRFDRAFLLRHDLQTIYKKQIPLQILTDSLQMFDVITEASVTTERRLMIDIAAARESYNRQEISNVGLVLSEHNVADCLTKVKANGNLEEIMKTGADKSPVQQWIFRDDASSSTEDGGV